MKGIYKYTDLTNGEIVYVGKDSHIDKNKRHRAHLSPSLYDAQQINRVLQNNPDRYEYGVIWASNNCTDLKLNKMEICVDIKKLEAKVKEKGLIWRCL